jgi:hypothetical protein
MFGLITRRKFRFAVLPSSTYLFTVGVEGFYSSLDHTQTPQSIGFLWTRDRLVAETSTWQHKHLQDTNIHATGGTRAHDPSKRSAADLRLRPRGHWDRLRKLHDAKKYIKLTWRNETSVLIEVLVYTPTKNVFSLRILLVIPHDCRNISYV